MQVPLRPLEAASWASSVVPGARYDLSSSTGPGTRGSLGAALPRTPDETGEDETAASWDEAEASLVHAIASRYGVDPIQVALTPGAGQAIVHALIAMLRPGDHVVVERPTYEPLHRVPEMLGASVARIDRRIEDDWQLLPERLAKVLTPRTRAVVLTNLHSPSGVACSPRTIAEIAGLAARVGATVLVDEVLLDHAFDLGPAAACRPACLVADNAICFSSTSKGLGLPELRVGWLVSRDPDAARGLRIAADYLHRRLPPATMRLAAHALRDPDDFRIRTARLAGAGRRVVERWVQGEPRVEWIPPHAGLHTLVRLPVGVSDLAFAAHLRARYETQVIPGSVLEAPQCVRLGFAAPSSTLEQGLANFSAALDDLLGGSTLAGPGLAPDRPLLGVVPLRDDDDPGAA
ncbi:MAG TPA: pyridoxal phosphate-dependent aminotransferase [Nannocystis sp.]